MTTAPAATSELPILRARAQGRLSADEAFERLYRLYAPTILGWLAMRVHASDADDLFQDVWTVFCGRWRRWQFTPEMEAPEARPVLSFLFQTCHFVLQGHRRRMARPSHSLAGVEVTDDAHGAEQLQWEVELGHCLGQARRVCPPEELDVLLAKLAGVPAREIARTLLITEPTVDHRFRNAVARLQKELAPASGRRRKKEP